MELLEYHNIQGNIKGISFVFIYKIVIKNLSITGDHVLIPQIKVVHNFQ
jgi:hypothetical protein